MTTATLTADTARTIDERLASRAPRLGGLSWTVFRLEIRRLVRNRRTVIFTLVLPAAFFLLFGTSSSFKTQSAGLGNVTAYVLVSMAVYGAMMSTTSGGAMVSIERAKGWSRQLRLTPLRPAAYIAMKVAVAMTIGLVSVVVVEVVGAFAGATMPMHVWILTGLLAWVCSLVFAAFGLFVGYLLPSENVMQILGPVLAVLSFAGGLFVPVDQLGHVFASIAQFTPVYGVGIICRYPMTHDGNLWIAVLNVVVWTALFGAGAAWRFRRDTSRV